MSSASQAVVSTSSPKTGSGTLWAARILRGIPVLFLAFDGILKLFKPPPVLEAFARLGYSQSTAVGIGVLLLTCVLVYVMPRTAVVGAILLTGYLGGAVATHVRVGDPLFSHSLATFCSQSIWLFFSGPDSTCVRSVCAL